jgi:hypothetical protein
MTSNNECIPKTTEFHHRAETLLDLGSDFGMARAAACVARVDGGGGGDFCLGAVARCGHCGACHKPDGKYLAPSVVHCVAARIL